MKKIFVKTTYEKKSYPIFIGKAILVDFEKLFDLKKYSKIVVITDKQIENLLFKNQVQFLPNNTSIITVPSGERAKTIETVEEIWKELLSQELDRKSLVINIGGGVVGDIGGFAASTYMRGIRFMQIPTTLLAMVDASIGGKTGINFLGTKNIIGSFAQPTAVIIDIDTLKTLPKRILVEGFGEIIKHGIIADKKYFTFVTSKKPEEFTNEEFLKIIEGSCKIKVRIFQKDPTEKGLRKSVNFGHTVGHALEALSLETKTPLLHGEAISIGMVAASFISFFKGMITENDIKIIKQALESAGLPITISGMNKKQVLDKMILDKKVERGRVRWTLLNGIGKAVVDQMFESAIVQKALAEVLV